MVLFWESIFWRSIGSLKKLSKEILSPEIRKNGWQVEDNADQKRHRARERAEADGEGSGD
jgi:hypothetical protein